MKTLIVSGGLSAALVAAIVVAAKEETCNACEAPENRGLCHSETCRQQVLPQLRETSLKRDAHSGHYYEPATTSETAQEQTRRSADHATRMARQSERRLSRLGRSVQGHFTRNHHRRSAV